MAQTCPKIWSCRPRSILCQQLCCTLCCVEMKVTPQLCSAAKNAHISFVTLNKNLSSTREFCAVMCFLRPFDFDCWLFEEKQYWLSTFLLLLQRWWKLERDREPIQLNTLTTCVIKSRISLFWNRQFEKAKANCYVARANTVHETMLPQRLAKFWKLFYHLSDTLAKLISSDWPHQVLEIVELKWAWFCMSFKVP